MEQKETLIILEGFGIMYQVSADSYCLTYNTKTIVSGLTDEQAHQALDNLQKLQN